MNDMVSSNSTVSFLDAWLKKNNNNISTVEKEENFPFQNSYEKNNQEECNTENIRDIFLGTLQALYSYT